MLCELRQAGLDLLGPSLLSPGRVGISAVILCSAGFSGWSPLENVL